MTQKLLHCFKENLRLFGMYPMTGIRNNANFSFWKILVNCFFITVANVGRPLSFNEKQWKNRYTSRVGSVFINNTRKNLWHIGCQGLKVKCPMEFSIRGSL